MAAFLTLFATATADTPAHPRFVAHAYDSPLPPDHGLDHNVIHMATVSAQGFTGYFDKVFATWKSPGNCRARIL